MSRTMKWGCGVLILLAAVAYLISNSETTAPKTSAPTTRMVTLDGTDPDAQPPVTIQTINLWDDYNTRSRVVATARHGETVKFIRREGDGVLVETLGGQRGWLTYYFIREFK